MSETVKLSEALGVKLPMSVAKSTDTRLKLNFLCNSWLPLASAVLGGSPSSMLLEEIVVVCNCVVTFSSSVISYLMTIGCF